MHTQWQLSQADKDNMNKNTCGDQWMMMVAVRISNCLFIFLFIQWRRLAKKHVVKLCVPQQFGSTSWSTAEYKSAERRYRSLFKLSPLLQCIVSWSGCQQKIHYPFYSAVPVMYSAHAFKSKVGIYHSEQITGELSFNISSLPQLPYLLEGLESWLE